MSEPLSDRVRNALRSVREPDVGKDLVQLGMVKKVEAAGGTVTVSIELPTPIALPSKRQALEASIRSAAAPLEGVSDVKVIFTSNVVGRPRMSNETRLPAVRNIIAVASGKGGVGKSTVAVNLALAMQHYGARIGLLDADIYGPSVPQMLGPPQVPMGTSTTQKIIPAIHYGMQVMSVGFFVERQGAVIWRGPMVHKLLQQFLEDVDWGELDYLVVDLPPGTGDVQLSLSQLIPLSGAVMVTTPQEVALSDVIRGISMFQKVEVPILGIVENMSGYVCPQCGHHDEIFSRGGGERLAAEVKTEFLGALPLDGRVTQGGDAGIPIVVGNPESGHAQKFLEIAAHVAGRVAAQYLTGPRRVPGLVAIT